MLCPCDALKVYGVLEEKLLTFLTSATDGVEWSLVDLRRELQSKRLLERTDVDGTSFLRKLNASM
jgi:hypothetical protein